MAATLSGPPRRRARPSEAGADAGAGCDPSSLVTTAIATGAATALAGTSLLATAGKPAIVAGASLVAGGLGAAGLGIWSVVHLHVSLRLRASYLLLLATLIIASSAGAELVTINANRVSGAAARNRHGRVMTSAPRHRRVSR